MDIFFHSTLLVALAEMGDKTQLLAIMLAARYPRHTWHIVIGILVATTLNHAAAAWVGTLLADIASTRWFSIVLAASFIAIGLWVLKPDALDEEEVKKDHGALITTLVTFFIAEMGDKTQLATVALAAEYKSLLPVIAGTTTGMLIANVPAVFFGKKLLQKISLRYVHLAAAGLFIGIGISILVPLFR